MKLLDRGFQYYKGLPTWGKAVVIIGGGAIAWFAILNPIRKLIIKQFDKAKSQKTVNSANSDVNNLAGQGVKPSFTDTQYLAWAEAIVTQFAGCDFSVAVPFFPGINLTYSGRTLYDIIGKLKNDADFAKLVSAFGVRTYDQCGFFTGNVENATLFNAVADELTTDEIQIINDKLKSQKINYQF